MKLAAKATIPLLTPPLRSMDFDPDQLRPARPAKLKLFLLNCSGVNVEILLRKECATEESKYVAIGALVLCTGIAAAISGSFALFSVFHSALAILFGVFWGGLVFCMDRFFVASMRKFKNNAMRGLIMAGFRLVMAALIGITVSKPLELEIFKPEIEFRLVADAAENRAEHERKAEASFPRIAELEREKKQLQAEIAESKKKRDAAYQAEVEEVEGISGTFLPGRGRAYFEKAANLETQTAELDSVKAQNTARIKEIDAKLTDWRAARDAAVANVVNSERRGNGMLARMRALDEIASDPQYGATLAMAMRLISWLFVIIEITPVLAKAAMSYGPYDSIMESRETAVILQSSDLTETLARSLEQQAEHDARLQERALTFEKDAFDSMLDDVRNSAAFADGQQELATGFLGRLKRRLAGFVSLS